MGLAMILMYMKYVYTQPASVDMEISSSVRFLWRNQHHTNFLSNILLLKFIALRAAYLQNVTLFA